MTPFRLDRRAVLKTSAATIALPLLDAMGWADEQPSAAARPPARFVSMFFGVGVPLPPPGHGHRGTWSWFPPTTGRDYVLSEIHRALAPFRDQMTFVSGMDNHRARITDGHSCIPQWLTGARPFGPNSISIDQLIAQRTGQDVFMPSLVLSGTATGGNTQAPPSLSFDQRGQRVPSEDNPRRTFERLFGRDAASIAQQRATIARERSVLDLALEQAKALEARLGSADRQRLNQHFEAIRQSEQELARAEQWLDRPRPKVDARIDPFPSGFNACRDAAELNRFYANHIETIAHAFATDSSRTAHFCMQAEATGGLNTGVSRLLGLNDIHSLSHDSGNPDYFKNWGVWAQCMSDQVGRLVKRLSELKEGDGTILDRTIILFGSQCSDVHWNRNYPTLLIGGSRLGLKHGRHLSYPNGEFSNLLATLLTCYGIDEPRFGHATGRVPALLEG
jgi:hypothetical protein